MKHSAFDFLFLYNLVLLNFLSICRYDHIGDTVNVIGFITDIITSKGIQGSETFFMPQGNDSNGSLVLVVDGPNHRKFKEGLQARYLNHFVQVKGKDMYKGKPRIILHREREIEIAREADMLSE